MIKLETVTERIKNAEEKIEKKTNTIEKKKNLITKKAKSLEKYGLDENSTVDDARKAVSEHEFFDVKWTIYDIDSLKDDIKRNEKEIEEIKNNLIKYKEQLEVAQKDQIVYDEMPEILKNMENELVERWDKFDIEMRDKKRQDYNEMSYSDFTKKYRGQDISYKALYATNEEIHKSNVDAAKKLVMDLFMRVKDITGEITDWSGVHATMGANGFTVLNGFVKGKEGMAEIESILAGGYNIQRLHVRTLVREYK